MPRRGYLFVEKTIKIPICPVGGYPMRQMGSHLWGIISIFTKLATNLYPLTGHTLFTPFKHQKSALRYTFADFKT